MGKRQPHYPVLLTGAQGTTCKRVLMLNWVNFLAFQEFAHLFVSLIEGFREEAIKTNENNIH